MAQRGVYTRELANMIEEWKEQIRTGAKWLPDATPHSTFEVVLNRTVTRELMKGVAAGVDHKNPLWLDDTYARGTRWGDIIGVPSLSGAIAVAGIERSLTTPTGFAPPMGYAMGGSMQWFKPIRAGDSFRVRSGEAATIEDKTRLDSKGPYLFLVSTDLKYINQRDEVVCISIARQMKQLTPYSEMKEYEPHVPTMTKWTPYRYTEEEMKFIERLYDEEEIRGARPRFWEDVNVGDKMKPITTGPCGRGDWPGSTPTGGGYYGLPRIEKHRLAPHRFLLDPVTNIWHDSVEGHNNDRVAQLQGINTAYIAGHQMDVTLHRLITNWIGDDGFMTRFDSEHRMWVPLDDTLFGQGKVIKKYVENGEHLVDLAVWIETIRGYICTIGTASASLPQKVKI
jgi:acyl dehydratase